MEIEEEVPEVVHCLDDKSVKNEADINVVDNTVNNEEEESDSEAVSDTYFGDNGDAQEHDNKEVEKSDINIQSDGRVIRDIRKEGGSILDTLDEMIKVGQTMGFTMDGCTKDMEKIIGSNGDHEVCKEDRWGSTFHAQGAISFNSFISNAGLNEVQLEGYSFT
nr:hypothetical protein [Tanacetum cinerariifolium]